MIGSVSYDGRAEVGIGRKKSVSSVVGMVFAVSILLLTRISAAQPTTQPTIPASGEPGATMEPAPREKAPVFDPGAPPKTTIQVAPFLTFGGRVKLKYDLEKNFDLDDARADDLSTLEPELSLAFSFDPNKHFQAFVDFDLSKKFTLEEEGKKKRPTKLELSHAFVFFKEVLEGLSFQIGRQRFRDDREWLYDEKLDAVRAFYRVSDLSLELSVSRKDLVNRDLLNDEPRERINNYVLYGKYALAKKAVIAAYTFVRDDRSPKRERPVFFGLHLKGEIVDDLDYWVELAHVRGRDGSKKIRGIGLDFGFANQFPLPLKPSIALGYAFGTGDADPNDGVDRSFRQTGLQDNEDKFHGVTRFKYYGELLDPELSNLSIFTGGIGIRPTRKSSIDLVYHYYLQDKASKTIRDAKINAKPTGLSKRLGSEIDLIAGYREIRNVDLKLVLGYFIPDKAFPPDADNSFFTHLEFRLSF